MTSADATDSSPWASLFPHKTKNWDFLVGIMQIIIHYRNNLGNKVRDKKKIDLVTYDVTLERLEARDVLVKYAQSIHFQHIINALTNNKKLNGHCKITELSPQVDEKGLLHVGGGLYYPSLPFDNRHPILTKDHIARYLVLHYHRAVKHQACYLSHGALREAGYHIEQGKTMIGNVLKSCILCCKLRGSLGVQCMSDPPVEHLERTPLFAHIDLDVWSFPYD